MIMYKQALVFTFPVHSEPAQDDWARGEEAICAHRWLLGEERENG